MHRTLSRIRSSLLALCCLVVLLDPALGRAADFGPGFKTQAVTVDGAVVSVTVAPSATVIERSPASTGGLFMRILLASAGKHRANRVRRHDALLARAGG